VQSTIKEKGELACMVYTFHALSDVRALPNDERCQSVMQDVNDSGKHEKVLVNKMEFSYDIRSADQKISPLLRNSGFYCYATRPYSGSVEYSPHYVKSACLYTSVWSRTCNCQCGEECKLCSRLLLSLTANLEILGNKLFISVDVREIIYHLIPNATP
jgi:hypothetical protein